MNAEKIVTSFIHAFEKGDYEKMEEVLAIDLVSHITNAKAGLDMIQGRDAYMKKVILMNVRTIKPNIIITQMAKIKKDQVLVMVEVKAEHNDRILHNHAAHLFTLKNDKIQEMWMVEALPAYSEIFWK